MIKNIFLYCLITIFILGGFNIASAKAIKNCKWD